MMSDAEINYLDTSCFFRIQEGTKGEYVSIGTSGNILRWTDPDNVQQWLVIPIDNNGLCRFMTRQNAEYMAVGKDGNILRWIDPDNEQKFRIVNKQPDGWFNIQEPTKNEFVSVGLDGNILRWAKNNEKSQQFKLEVAEIMPRLTLEDNKEWYSPSQIPKPPDLKSFDVDPPITSERYFISAQVLPAVLVDDPNYSDKVAQVKGSPYYTLNRYQQWSRDEQKGHGSLKDYSGVSNDKLEVKITVGMTQEQRQEVERIIGWKVTGELSTETKVEAKVGDDKIGVKGEKKNTGKLQVGYSNTTTTRQWASTTIENKKEVTKTVEYPQRKDRFRIAVWSLIDIYTLTDNGGKVIKEWSIVSEPAKVTAAYPATVA
jgi:hypothetical protein